MYPSLEQYQQTLQNHKAFLIDPELKNGKISMSGLGMPTALCGGFALTYSLQCQNRKYAVRCFHKKSDALELRYRAISKTLKALHSDYFLQFEFQPKGILVDGTSYPIVKMEWATGDTLGQFLEDHFSEKQFISNLKQSIHSLSSFLSRAGIAHGDIQPGNVVITRQGNSIHLIDYDGMYVPDIRNLSSSELGHRNFQHPGRSARHFNSSLDKFSLISLYLALKALEEDPLIWTDTNSDPDAVLFRSNDYSNPENSITFSRLYKIASLSRDIQNFAAICKTPFESIPSLEDFILGRNIPQHFIIISSLAQPSKPVRYVSQYPVLDGTDYSFCKRYIGDKVELIGKIHSIKKEEMINGDPYLYLNFGDWRTDIVKIIIWPNELKKFKSMPDQSWIGKWISVTGLMEPPYSHPRNKYTHLFVNLADTLQLHIIPENEALYRLQKDEESLNAMHNTTVLEHFSDKTKFFAGETQKIIHTNQKVLCQIQGKDREHWDTKELLKSRDENKSPSFKIVKTKKERFLEIIFNMTLWFVLALIFVYMVTN